MAKIWSESDDSCSRLDPRRVVFVRVAGFTFKLPAPHSPVAALARGCCGAGGGRNAVVFR